MRNKADREKVNCYLVLDKPVRNCQASFFRISTVLKTQIADLYVTFFRYGRVFVEFILHTTNGSFVQDSIKQWQYMEITM